MVPVLWFVADVPVVVAAVAAAVVVAAVSTAGPEEKHQCSGAGA
jgi:hypothetical protein